MKDRLKMFQEAFPNERPFRLRQFLSALFLDSNTSFSEITVFPRHMRETLGEKIPWMMWDRETILVSKNKDTHKAILFSTWDNAKIETVLMKNARGHWTICVSSQVGCPMKCAFCATGTMGFIRNLSQDEILDQYRFWKEYAREKQLQGEITNIVFMGMGEPLANYDAVKSSIGNFIEYAGIGMTRITVSTVGFLPTLETILTDPQWPNVRLAISLHSADEKTRNILMPSSYEGFLEKLSLWIQKYFQTYPGRRRHITFEYVLLGGVNDTDAHAEKLLRFSRSLGKVRINLIPYNATDSNFHSSKRIEYFQNFLKRGNIVVTVRRSLGDDIDAACGQLVVG